MYKTFYLKLDVFKSITIHSEKVFKFIHLSKFINYLIKIIVSPFTLPDDK